MIKKNIRDEILRVFSLTVFLRGKSDATFSHFFLYHPIRYYLEINLFLTVLISIYLFIFY